jgi:signal transduction histidine kinase
LLLRVTDHGVGISQKPGQKAGLGVGLATMHKRARQIDAVLTVTDIQPGTCVALRMQLP